MTNEYDNLIQINADKYGVPFEWIKAVMMTESSGNPDAYRAEPAINDASYGLMQLLMRTAKGLGYSGAPEGLYDPMINLDLGSKLLAQLQASYGDDFQAVYSAYNSGSPTKYQTSTQVATNVSHATGWLDQVKATLSQLGTDIQTGITSDEGSSSIIMLVLIALGAYLLFK